MRFVSPLMLVRQSLIALVLGVGLTSLSAHAQAGLEVNAVNVQENIVVDGVTVHVVNEAIGFSDTRPTDADGRVEWRGLSTSGSYTVFVEENDRFYAARAADLELRSNFTRSVTLLLSPIAKVELDEVVVEGNRGIAEINRVNAEVSSSMSAQSLENIPVEGRNVTQSLYRLPNVAPSTGFFPEAPNVSINGANGDRKSVV